jgi:hypothetical protein
VKRFQELIRAAAPAREPFDAFPEAAAAKVAAQCDAADIADIVFELERLSAEKSDLPDWDGDSQDIVARHQELLAAILAAVPERLMPYVRRGLSSRDELARRYLELALQRRETRAVSASNKGGLPGKIRELLRKICLFP